MSSQDLIDKRKSGEHPTVRWPTEPDKYYLYLNYREWFYGPFESQAAAETFAAELYALEPYYDYDGIAMFTNPNGVRGIENLTAVLNWKRP